MLSSVYSILGIKMSDNSVSELYKKIKACWLGKNIGGTLGMPYEGKDGPFSLEYYNPIPKNVVPNDDLDLQILWVCFLNEMSQPEVSRYILAEAWKKHVKFPFDEYAVAIKNLSLGIEPPMTGSYDNWFTCGMGAAIRSEIWACLAPGNPHIAVKYAYEDACVDHADDGIGAEVFLAALESAAFTYIGGSLEVLINDSLKYISSSSILYQAVTDTIKWWHDLGDWLCVRNKILEIYEGEDWTDVTMNICFIVLALLDGKGDFGKSICTAANCGKDTDCTAATVGAIIGIMNPESIDEYWLRPIGEKIILSPEIVGIVPPSTVTEFTDLIIELQEKLNFNINDVPEVEQSLSKCKIKVGVAFTPLAANFCVDYMPNWPNYKMIDLPGTLASLSYDDFEDELLFVKYDLVIKRSDAYRIMFNTKEDCRIWLDGKYAFGRECGRMAPSPHRGVLNQYIDIHLPKGNHDLVAIIRRPKHIRDIQWQVAVAEKDSRLLVPEALYGHIPLIIDY